MHDKKQGTMLTRRPKAVLAPAVDQRAFTREAIHALRNPLTAIQLGIETLTLGETDPEGRGMLEHVLSDAGRMAEMLRDWIEKETVQLNGVLASDLAAWQTVIQDRGITVTHHDHSEVMTTSVDTALIMRQFVGTLFAMMPDATSSLWSLKARGTDGVLTAHLDGPGIKPNKVAEMIDALTPVLATWSGSILVPGPKLSLADPRPGTTCAMELCLPLALSDHHGSSAPNR